MILRKVRDVDQATGVHLDVLGRNVGLARGSRTDDEFRRAIKVERLAQRSNGTISEVRTVAEIVLDRTVSITEMWNNTDFNNEAAGLVLEVIAGNEGVVLPDPTIQTAVAGGVRLASQVKNNIETIEVQEPLATLFPIISLQTGTFTLAQNLGSLF